MDEAGTSEPVGPLVMKFGGTSVGSAARIRDAAHLIAMERGRRPVVIVSAVSGVTNTLLEGVEHAAAGRDPDVQGILAKLRAIHARVATCIDDADDRAAALAEVDGVLEALEPLLRRHRHDGRARPRARRSRRGVRREVLRADRRGGAARHGHRRRLRLGGAVHRHERRLRQRGPARRADADRLRERPRAADRGGHDARRHRLHWPQHGRADGDARRARRLGLQRDGDRRGARRQRGLDLDGRGRHHDDRSARRPAGRAPRRAQLRRGGRTGALRREGDPSARHPAAPAARHPAAHQEHLPPGVRGHADRGGRGRPGRRDGRQGDRDAPRRSA